MNKRCECLAFHEVHLSTLNTIARSLFNKILTNRIEDDSSMIGNIMQQLYPYVSQQCNNKSCNMISCLTYDEFMHCMHYMVCSVKILHKFGIKTEFDELYFKIDYAHYSFGSRIDTDYFNIVNDCSVSKDTTPQNAALEKIFKDVLDDCDVEHGSCNLKSFQNVLAGKRYSNRTGFYPNPDIKFIKTPTPEFYSNNIVKILRPVLPPYVTNNGIYLYNFGIDMDDEYYPTGGYLYPFYANYSVRLKYTTAQQKQISHRINLNEELLCSPPNSLLPDGGMLYQESLKEYSGKQINKIQ